MRPGYRELPAPPALRGVVACTWTRVAERDGDVRVVPDGCSDLVWTQGAGVMVAGPDTAAQLAPLAAGAVMVGVRLAPGAGGAALGLPLAEVRDLRVAAGDLDRLFVVSGEAPPAQALAHLLRAVAGRDADPLVRAAAERLEHEDVGVVARSLALSERQLRRRCHDAAGYGPKTLARILRFRRFTRALDAGADDLAGLAVACGYADQAHLTRECTRLAGLPPAALRRDRGARRPAAGSAAPPAR